MGWLLPFIVVVWLMWAVAATLQVRVRDVVEPLTDGNRRGMSVVPVIPLFPLLLWGIANLVDLGVAPWGTVLIGSLHVLFALALVISIARDWFRLRRLRSIGHSRSRDEYST